MFPQIPENLSALSLDALRSLRDELKAAGAAYRALPEDEQNEHAEEAIAAAAALSAVRERITVLENAAAASAAFTDDDGDDDAGEGAGDDDNGAGDDDGAGEGAGDDETQASLIERRGAPAPTAVVPAGAGARASAFLAYDNVTLRGKKVKAGTAFASFTDLAVAMHDRARNVRPGSNEKFEVARVPAQFDPALVLSDNPIENLAIWDAMVNPRGRDVPEELTAAFCALPTPIYDLDCENTTRRPVKNGLPNLAAPRAAVAIHPSPSLSDIVDTAVGTWTTEDDDDEEAVKGPCATITCGDPETFEVYGVWACMTVKNLMTLNFPELIAQYLNRLAAAHARLGEIQLLNAMATRSTPITAFPLGYGTATTITTQLMAYLALYQEQQRWDDMVFDVWAHRWVQTAIRIDLSRRNRDGTWSVATEAQADAVFRDAGFEPHWFIDQPAWSNNLPAIHTGFVLNDLPDTTTVLVHPRGKFAVMDRGELTVGVTGNNIYRDMESNLRNQFSYFFENFEGVVDTGCAPAHLITFDGLCHSGYQIADVSIECDGTLSDDLGQAAGSS